MKALLIGITPPQEGGSERHIYEISKRIRDSEVLTQADSICKNKIPVNLPEKHFFRILFFILAVLIRIPKIMFSDYTTIHIHENYLFFFIPIFRIKFKVIATIHGIKGFKFYDNKFLWFFYKLPLYFANKIVAVNIEDKNQLSKELRGIAYIPNGADISIYEKSFPSVEKKIVFIGRIHEQKGLVYLLQAFEKIEKEFPEFKLEILGKINPYASELKKKFPSKGIAWRGFISERKQIVKSLKSAYCIVLPSLWEGLPLTLIESLASSRPLVLSSIPAFKSIIKDEALFFKTKDSGDLAKKIAYLIKNKPFADMLGRKGFILSKRYDWQAIAGKILELY